MNGNESEEAHSFLNILGLKLNNKLSPKEQAIQNDIRLQNCAAYDMSKGLTLPITDRDALTGKFAEFKAMVRSRSISIDQLETRLAIKYGIVEGMQDELDELLSTPVELEKGKVTKDGLTH